MLQPAMDVDQDPTRPMLSVVDEGVVPADGHAEGRGHEGHILELHLLVDILGKRPVRAVEGDGRVQTDAETERAGCAGHRAERAALRHDLLRLRPFTANAAGRYTGIRGCRDASEQARDTE